MKGCEVMKCKPLELWFIWQNVETRQRYHIGTLLYKDGLFSFHYELKGYRRKLRDALDNGYKPHLAFPDIYKEYTSKTLFSSFTRRLPDPRRPDYNDVLASLGLSLDSTEMDVLRVTGGLLATDSYEFVAPIIVSGNQFHFDFFIAGWRYYEGEKVINQLKKGDSIKFILDSDKSKDDKAVIVMSANDEKLGYIPAFYSGFMYGGVEKGWIYQTTIEGIYKHALPHRKIKVAVNGTMTEVINLDLMSEENDELQMIAFS